MSAQYVVAGANVMNEASGLATTGCSACTESESDPIWGQRDTPRRFRAVSWSYPSLRQFRPEAQQRHQFRDLGSAQAGQTEFRNWLGVGKRDDDRRG